MLQIEGKNELNNFFNDIKISEKEKRKISDSFTDIKLAKNYTGFNI